MMENTISTPRLKLTLISAAERGSPEFEWLHEVRSDAQTTLWSIAGQSKSPEDTEDFVRRILPIAPEKEGGKPSSYRVNYAVHEVLEPPAVGHQEAKSTRFIGTIAIRSLGGPNDLVLPEPYTPISTLSPSVLSIELSYQFLPLAWGRGFATEAVSAFLDTLQRATVFWQPFEKVYVRAIVNEENPASLGVMRKLGLQSRGVYEWTGKPIWLGGRWTERSRIFVFGGYLID